MLEEIFYRIFEFVILTLMFTLFGLYIVYLFVEWIILSVASVFQSIYQR